MAETTVNFNSAEKKDLTAQQTSAEDFVVHTMPQKFLSLRPKSSSFSKRVHKKHSFKTNLIIGIVVIVVFGLLMMLAAWLFVKSVKQDSSPQNNVLNNQATPAEGDLLGQSSAKQSSSNATTTPPAQTSATDNLLDIEQWQTIENSRYNYIFKVPAEWQKSLVTGEESSNKLEEISFKDQNDNLFFKLIVFDNPHQLSLDSWLGSVQQINFDQLQPFTLYNQPAYKFTNQQLQQYIIYALYGHNIYALTFNQPQNELERKINNNILINFKFTPLKETAAPSPDELPQFVPAVDSDHDGLTDLEEELYGTDKSKRDTDADGYTDGDEVANLYNPLQPGNARIYDSQLVTTYVNSQYYYNLVYPAAWQFKDDGDLVIFQDKDGEFIQVLVVKDTQGYSDILDWYKANVSLDTTQLTKFTIDGVPAIRTLDGYKAYFLYNGHIYSLIYNIGLRQDANFMVTFDMIIKSLSLMPVD